MPRGQYLSCDLKELIIKFHKSGEKQCDISKRLSVHKSIVSRVLKNFKVRGNVLSKKKTGRPKKTSIHIDKQILRISKNNPFMSSRNIKNIIQEDYAVNVTSRTIRNRLIEGNLMARRPAKKPLLSKKNIAARIEFAKDHINWSEHQWERVIFSDESKFNLHKSDGRVYVRRPEHKRLDPKYVSTTLKFGGGSVMVWGCFSGFGVGPLYKIDGIMDRFMYKDILINQMVPFAEDRMPLKHWFQQDNDPKHTSKLLRDWFATEKINVMKWPSQSPDINPIENLWEIVDNKIRFKNYANKDELFLALDREWKTIDPQVVQNLIRSMPRRCAEILKNKGYWTKY